MIKTILFDLDDTLLDFKKAEQIAIASTLSRMGIRPDEEVTGRYREINEAQWKLLEKNELTRDEVKTRRFRLLFDELAFEADENAAALTYERLLSTQAYYIDGAEELLQSLCGRYDLYLVSNGTAVVQEGRLKISGIKKYFKEAFVSETIGFNKPDIE